MGRVQETLQRHEQEDHDDQVGLGDTSSCNQYTAAGRMDPLEASATLLPLHTSQSAPILFRRSHSFGSLVGSSRGTALADTVSRTSSSSLRSSVVQQGVLQGGYRDRHRLPRGRSSNLFRPSHGYLYDNISENYNLECHALYTDEEDDDEHDEDDSDTFVNECDIEDQVTVQSQSSLNSTTMSGLSSKLNPSNHTLATEEVTISSDSDDADVSAARISSLPYPVSTLSSSDTSLRRWRRHRSKMHRDDFSSSTLSSVGTLSKYQKHQQVVLPTIRLKHTGICTSSDANTNIVIRPSRKHVWCRPRLKFSHIVLLLKTLASVWLLSASSFIFYHFYLYSPTSRILPLVDNFKIRGPGKGYGWHHIPVPPPDHKVSVILMNHSRPRMIKESALVPTLLHHPSVEEVVILHSNPKTKFNFVHPKVVNIDATKENDRMGLSIRFYFCQMAKSDWVLHVDDDMEFTDKTLNEMLYEFSKNTKRIVGRFGREFKKNNFFNGYSSRDTSRQTEVILTKFMVMEREMCSAFFQYSHLIWEDIVLDNGDGPLWNGEDIFMSLVSNHVYGRDGERVNYAMDWLDVWNAPEELKDYSFGKFDISGGFSGYRFWDFNWWRSLLNRNRHYSYRGKLWTEAKERLKSVGPHQSLSQQH